MKDNNYNLDNLDLVCTENCYKCPYNEECDNSDVSYDELLNGLDEW